MEEEYYDEDDQLALQLAEQKYQMESISEVLQIILNSLQQQFSDSKESKQTLILQYLLDEIKAGNKKNSNSLREFSQQAENSLTKVREDNAKLQVQYSKLKQQLDYQKDFLHNHFSIKSILMLCMATGLITCTMTVFALQLFQSSAKTISPTPIHSPTKKTVK
jgi:hypothetical protein